MNNDKEMNAAELAYQELEKEILQLRLKFPLVKQLVIVGGVDVPNGKRSLNFTTYYGDDLDNAINMINVAKAQLGYTIEDNKKKQKINE